MAQRRLAAWRLCVIVLEAADGCWLTNCVETPAAQFIRQGGLINGFQQARAKRRLHAEFGLKDRGIIEKRLEGAKPVFHFRSSLMEWFIIQDIQDAKDEKERRPAGGVVRPQQQTTRKDQGGNGPDLEEQRRCYRAGKVERQAGRRLHEGLCRSRRSLMPER